ncbi:hypothetical protein [Hyalangium rubrum]|uniref:Uncharacterized protein n=1 Tax=Hyalangium rubrum TaxID=3103134 RepID=A0ABU5H0Z6_9BACT|nr:hypothetical protein [Hyalangium sp. s54d21]MDY7225775.1 hypothetical protein [Hyalangium sp. s54d21]
MDPRHPELLRVPTVLGEQRKVVPLEGELPVPVRDEEEQVVWVPLQSISQLWKGSALPPDLSVAPPPEYEPFFLLLEATAAEYCDATGRPERDKEFERLYRLLTRRPDSVDPNPLFSYLQAAARLYLSLREVSRAEFEAVADRLRHSAKTFASRLDSTNYHRLVLGEFFHP